VTSDIDAPGSATLPDGALRRRLDAGITGWQGVSPRFVWVELAGVAVAAIIGLAVAAAGLLLDRWVGFGLLAVVVILAGIRLALTPRRVRAIGYVLREDDLVFRRGILYSRLVAVPYGRMQLVDITRGPIARALGLAELRLVTAAASTEVTLPGLPEQQAATLRDELVARAESRRVGL
jgi:membrane protein YdbS with pleckstrin-like domain